MGAETERSSGTIVATAAYRASPHLAFGVHATGARYRVEEELIGNSVRELWRWNVYEIDLAVAAQYEQGRVTVAPWAGGHGIRVHEEEEVCILHRDCQVLRASWWSQFAIFGVTATIDVGALWGRRVVVFADLAHGRGQGWLEPEDHLRPQVSFSYGAISVGVAYRR